MTRLIDAELLTTKISFVGFPHIDRNGRIDKSWVYNLINSCPTVDERPKGEWIMNKTSARGRNYTCTNCKKVSRNKFDFCPKCGAEMEADNESI